MPSCLAQGHVCVSVTMRTNRRSTSFAKIPAREGLNEDWLLLERKTETFCFRIQNRELTEFRGT